MKINNNDLIEEAMKRRGFETDRPLRIRFNKKDYAGFNGENVFKLSKIDNEYVLHLANNINSIWFNLYDFLFDNKNDIDVEFVGDKEINPIDIKNQVCKLYFKYIELSKIYRNETISVADLVGETGIPRTYNIANKLEVLAEILGYDIKKVKKDIEREDY